MIILNKAEKNSFVLKTSSKSADILEVNTNLSNTTNVSGVISTDKTYTDCKIEVINTTIQNNANVILDAKESTTINGPFEVKIGSTLEIK